MQNEMTKLLSPSIQNSKPQTMKYIIFFKALFLFVSIPAFSQRQYSTYQKDGYVGLEFVENHNKITLPIYEKITPCIPVQKTNTNSYIFDGLYKPKVEMRNQIFLFGEMYLPDYIEFWKVRKHGKCGIINKEGKSIVPTSYDDIIYLIDTSFAIISEDGKTGLVHKNGTVIIPSVYEKIMCLQSSNGQFIVEAYTKLNFSLINERGTILSTFPITLIGSIKENHVILTSKYSQLKGASDIYGHEILPQVYDELDLSFGVFSFKKDGEAGLMDLTGKRIFSRIGNNLFHIKVDRSMIDINHNAYQLIDNAGTTLCTDTFSTISVHTDFMIVKVKSTGKSGVLSFDGEMILPAIYQSLDVWNKMLVTKKEDTYGIINISGNTLLPFHYQKIIISSENVPFLLVKQNEKYGCIDKQLQLVLPCKYEKLDYIYYTNGNIGPQECVRILSENGTTRGVIDLNGNVKIPYEQTTFIGKKNETFAYGFLPHIQLLSDYLHGKKITNSGDKEVDCIILDNAMRELLRCYSKSINLYDDYFMIATINKKFGMLAADGVTVIPFIYDQLYPFGNEYLVGKKDRCLGLLSRSNNTRIAFQYSALEYFSEDYIIAQDTNSIPQSGLIDYTGKIQIPFLYNSLYSDKRFYTNLLIAKKDDLYGVIDVNEKEIIPFKYDEIQQFNKTLFIVKKYGKYGLVNTSNQNIIPNFYEYLFYINDTIFKVKNNGMYGLLNSKNHFITSIVYEEINFSNTVWYRSDKIFEVKRSYKAGSIDINGNIILPIEFSYIDFDDDAFGRVCKDSLYYFAHGPVVNYSEPYEEILRIKNMFRIKKNGKYGVANYKGDVIIEPVYDRLDSVFSGFIAEKNSQKTTFDKSGKMIIPFK